MMRKAARNKFANWRKSRSGKEYLAVLFVESNGKCPQCLCLMILSYEDKTYTNRATFNHKIHLADAPELALSEENLEILCWKCNNEDSNIIKLTNRH